MRFATSLKKLLTAFVEVYEAYFSKTIIAALLWTVLCFAIAQVLAAYSNYAPQTNIQPVSVLSYFVLRFSSESTYSFVDLVKTVFIFLVSIFSVNLIRKQQPSGASNKITVKDIIYLTAILLACILLDCALFRLKDQLRQGINNTHLLLWMQSITYILRIFLPMVLFAVIIQVCTSKAKFTAKKIVLLLISVWLFNQVWYEFTTLIRGNVFGFLLSPLQTPSYRYIAETLLGLPLIACCFLGFYCAMTAPFDILDEHSKA